jgi:alkylhydroperoxidase family enzyme
MAGSSVNDRQPEAQPGSMNSQEMSRSAHSAGAAYGPGMARIDPLPPDQWPEGMRAALAALRPAEPRHPFPSSEGRPKGLGVLGTLAHHPELARAYNTFNGHVLFATRLTPRQRELLVLRVAALRDAEYEWAQHVVMAGDVGITDDEVDRIAAGVVADGWSELDGALLQAAEELVRDASISDPVWAALAAELEVEQLMDVIFTVGAYDVLAMLFRAFGVELDDDLPRR